MRLETGVLVQSDYRKRCGKIDAVLHCQSLARWLFHGPLRLPSGAFYSWHAGDDSEFLYPEVAALALRLGIAMHHETGDQQWQDLLTPSLSYLSSTVQDGVVQHRGAGWLFDTVLAWKALGDAKAAGIPGDYQHLIPVMEEKALEMIQQRQSTTVALPRRWSTRFRPHLLKSIALLLLSAPSGNRANLLKTAGAELIFLQEEDGGFGPPSFRPAYLHAHAYALEGLIMLCSTELSPLARPAFDKGLAFLAAQRCHAPGYPQWENKPSHPIAADVTAQACRLFLLQRPQKTKEAEGCFLALQNLHLPESGYRYTSDNDHTNSWATIFAAQAYMMAARSTCDPEVLL